MHCEAFALQHFLFYKYLLSASFFFHQICLAICENKKKKKKKIFYLFIYLLILLLLLLFSFSAALEINKIRVIRK